MKHFKIIVLMIGIFIGNLCLAQNAIDYKSATNSTETIVPSFSKLTVAGNVEVTLLPDSYNRQITITQNGDQLSKQVEGNELILSNQLNEPQRKMPANMRTDLPKIKITISGCPISEIETRDDARVVVPNWQAYAPITISASGNSVININGMINLQRVNLSDNAQLFATWINSPELLLEADTNSFAELSGITDRLFAKLQDSAELNAKYLRVQDLHVKTQDFARAEVTPLTKFAGFAYDKSNVLYYKTPGHLLDISAESGNVLQVGYWN